MAQQLLLVYTLRNLAAGALGHMNRRFIAALYGKQQRLEATSCPSVRMNK